jgi:acetylornithine/succinyldiaminopimelate/putrescine aminotransferase
VVEAIKHQVDKYMHIMVYGEMVESPQVQFAAKLAEHLPIGLDAVYFTNSGAEAVEGAMKLAKRVTGRTKIISFNESYHGSTQGALSIIGDEYWRNAFRPLLPDVYHLQHGVMDDLDHIDTKTACVVVELIQAERGVITPSAHWVKELRKKCTDVGAMLIVDEIQTGFGRTGYLFASEKFDIIPDVILLGKAIGGGMPLGAFVSSRSNMMQLATDPVLGHITTFGGHPVCCAAGLASMNFLIDQKLISNVDSKRMLFEKILVHPMIKSFRSAGMLMAIEFDSFEINKRVIDLCIENGVFTDWFLFAAHCMRLAPPLVITDEEIIAACKIILKCCDLVQLEN